MFSAIEGVRDLPGLSNITISAALDILGTYLNLNVALEDVLI